MAAVAGVDGQIEAAGELHSAQDAQGVFGKSIAGGAQDAVVEVHLAAEEIPDFAGDGVEAHGVDGEVAAGGGFARGDGFVELGVKIAVAGAGFAVAAGDAEVTCMSIRTRQISRLRSSCRPDRRGRGVARKAAR